MGVRVGGYNPHTYEHFHACTCTHTCMHFKYDNFMHMAAPMRGSLGNTYDVIMHLCVCMHACAHIHVHVCGGVAPPTSPIPTHPLRGHPQISKNSIRLE